MAPKRVPRHSLYLFRPSRLTQMLRRIPDYHPVLRFPCSIGHPSTLAGHKSVIIVPCTPPVILEFPPQYSNKSRSYHFRRQLHFQSHFFEQSTTFDMEWLVLL